MRQLSWIKFTFLKTACILLLTAPSYGAQHHSDHAHTHHKKAHSHDYGSEASHTSHKQCDCEKEVLPIYKIGPFEVTKPLIRPTTKADMPSAAYMTLKNIGAQDDRLLKVTSEHVRKIDIHNTLVDDKGVMKMVPLQNGIQIKAGDMITLAPRGTHLMLMGSNKALKKGEYITLKLHFEKAKTFDLMLKIGAEAPRKIEQCHH